MAHAYVEGFDEEPIYISDHAVVLGDPGGGGANWLVFAVNGELHCVRADNGGEGRRLNPAYGLSIAHVAEKWEVPDFGEERYLFEFKPEQGKFVPVLNALREDHRQHDRLWQEHKERHGL